MSQEKLYTFISCSCILQAYTNPLSNAKNIIHYHQHMHFRQTDDLFIAVEVFGIYEYNFSVLTIVKVDYAEAT